MRESEKRGANKRKLWVLDFHTHHLFDAPRFMCCTCTLIFKGAKGASEEGRKYSETNELPFFFLSFLSFFNS